MSHTKALFDTEYTYHRLTGVPAIIVQHLEQLHSFFTFAFQNPGSCNILSIGIAQSDCVFQQYDNRPLSRTISKSVERE